MKRLTVLLASFATLGLLSAFSAPAEAGGRYYGGGHYYGGGYRGYYGGGYYHSGYYRGGYRCCYRGGVFFSFGVPWPGYWWGPSYYYGAPYYYGSPYYYGYGAPVYYDDYYAPAARTSPQYVERSDVEAAPPPQQQQQQQQQPQQTWWYWCQSSEKYWPYVKECTGGFQRVPAQPTPPSNR